MKIEVCPNGSPQKITLLDVHCSDSIGVSNFRLPLFAPAEMEKISDCKVMAYDTPLVTILKERTQEIRLSIWSNKSSNLRTYTTDTTVNLVKLSNQVLTVNYNTWY